MMETDLFLFSAFMEGGDALPAVRGAGSLRPQEALTYYRQSYQKRLHEALERSFPQTLAHQPLAARPRT